MYKWTTAVVSATGYYKLTVSYVAGPGGISSFNTLLCTFSPDSHTLASSDFANQGTTTTVLHGNAAGNPSWSKVSLTADVSGILPVTNGGTNKSSWTAGSIVFAGASGTALAEDNTNFFWDDSANAILLGDTTAPAYPATGKSQIYSANSVDTNSISQLFVGNSVSNLAIGYENHMIVYNTTGSTIAANKVVYASGSHSHTPTIALAKADSATTMPAIGVTQYAIANNTYGVIQTGGQLFNVDTSAVSAGNVVYVSATTAGAYTATAPTTTGQYNQMIGQVTYSNPTQGTIQVFPQTALQAIRTTSSGGTGTGTTFTAGSVVFAGTSGIYTQDNSNFFWDSTNHRLGLGTTSPAQTLHVVGAIRVAGAATLTSTSAPGVFSLESTVLREYVGDGTGYTRTFSKRTGSVTTDLVAITDSGVVSIGTASPSGGAKLNVEGTTNSGLYSVNRNLSTGTAATAYFISDTSSGYTSFAGFGARSSGYSASGMLDASGGSAFTVGLSGGLGIMTLDNAPVKLGVNNTECIRLDTSGNTTFSIGYLKVSSTAGLGFATGAGGSVTQITSRTTGVTLNKSCGSITLVSAAGTATWQTFTVTNSTVAATDTIVLNQSSGTDLYMLSVTNVAAGSFKMSFATTGGTTTEQPVFNFSVIKAVTS
jgi:hypothetical protein